MQRGDLKIMKAKAQSILEYSILVMLTASAMWAISSYVTRAMNKKFTLVRLELNESQRGFNNE